MHAVAAALALLRHHEREARSLLFALSTRLSRKALVLVGLKRVADYASTGEVNGPACKRVLKGISREEVGRANVYRASLAYDRKTHVRDIMNGRGDAIYSRHR